MLAPSAGPALGDQIAWATADVEHAHLRFSPEAQAERMPTCPAEKICVTDLAGARAG